MPHDYRIRFAKRVEQADHVANEMEKRVLIDRVGPVGLPETAHVGRHGMEPGRGQRLKLMAPGVPRFREPVTQQHDRSGALFRDVHADPVRFEEATPSVR